MDNTYRDLANLVCFFYVKVDHFFSLYPRTSWNSAARSSESQGRVPKPDGTVFRHSDSRTRHTPKNSEKKRRREEKEKIPLDALGHPVHPNFDHTVTY